jgi:hypothetical protein
VSASTYECEDAGASKLGDYGPHDLGVRLGCDITISYRRQAASMEIDMNPPLHPAASGQFASLVKQSRSGLPCLLTW